MKSLKAAAIVAGSLVVAGLATPALAVSAAGGQPADLNGTVSGITDSVQMNGKGLLNTKQALPKSLQETTSGLGSGRLAG